MPSQHMPRILVVEDEVLIRSALREFLAGVGFRVLEAVNGDEAVRILKRLGAKIEAVVTDVRMPGSLDGFGVTEWVHSCLPGIPVILTTGDIGAALRNFPLSAKDIFLPKPYSFDRLATEVRARCRQGPKPGLMTCSRLRV